MRHHKKMRIFGRERNVRRALMRSLASAFIVRGSMETTEAKAKEIRPFLEKLITISKKDNLANRRLLESRLSSRMLASKLVKDIAPRYKDRPGGYVRIVKTGRRKSDAAPMAVIALV